MMIFFFKGRKHNSFFDFYYFELLSEHYIYKWVGVELNEGREWIDGFSHF